MGWNSGYTIFEATVIGAYDLGVLDRRLLKVLMEPYRNTDIDSGGSRDLRTKDGKGVEQVVIEAFGMKMPEKPKLPKDYAKWTDDERKRNEAWHEAVYEKFRKVTSKFGWR
jgi:hypothetical protein